MRWNATADLTAGAVITTVGVVCVARVRRPRDLPVAAVPLLLGAHQLVEAAVWNAGGGSGPATTAWAVIALPVLPVATRPVTAEIRGHTLGYGVNVPWMPLVLAGYLFATLGALLLAGDRRLRLRLRLLGVVLGAGALACSAPWRLEFASTRCTFAAVACLLVPGWVRRRGAGVAAV
ncbi:DUF6629 family protein [Streptomyces sp. NPDC006430]|uniref:DUF6629 family protein n=1 Tax=Streptomyces sp. NPDC006430 TaxID=3154299 RepID=UPI0033A34C57